ncbi:MAG: hypothetical protein K2G67_05010 [Muribaculaceae bacterium]|nr:hypothetical protein [Muribaculaceae bacterium]
MEKKRILTRALLAMCLCASLTMGGCGNGSDDEPIDPDNPTKPINPDTPVADPDNTVTVNLLVGMTSSDATELGGSIRVYVDAAHNLCCYYGDIIDIGKVSGLGNITEIPTEGWKNKAAITVGHGYVLKYLNNYARLYVDEPMISTTDAIMGYTVKYQCPMTVDLPVVLETSQAYLNYSENYNTSGVWIYIRSGNNLVVKSKPEWCAVTISEDEKDVWITAEPNDTGMEREGTIVIGNSKYEATLTVTQGTYGF